MPVLPLKVEERALEGSMNSIKNWLASYNITTHSVVVVLAFLTSGFYFVPPFHALVMEIYHALPGWAEKVVLAAVALYAWYRKGQPEVVVPVDGANSLHINS
jgi:hypothetical protein